MMILILRHFSLNELVFEHVSCAAAKGAYMYLQVDIARLTRPLQRADVEGVAAVSNVDLLELGRRSREQRLGQCDRPHQGDVLVVSKVQIARPPRQRQHRSELGRLGVPPVRSMLAGAGAAWSGGAGCTFTMV